jgi:hypothetical protein
MTNSKASDNFKLVQTLRAMYEKAKYESFEEEKRIWGNIESICELHGINSDIIIMEEFAFQEFSIPVVEHIMYNGRV